MNPEELFVMEAEDVTAPVCLCVLIVCVLVAAFLFPRITIDSHLAQTQVPIVPELAMVGTRNPFAVKILNPHLASVKDGIKLLLTTSVQSELHALWVVDCFSLQRALQDCSIQLLHDASRSLQGHFLHHTPPVTLAAETKTEIALTLPDTVTDTQIQAMGPPPRNKYPLCLVIKAAEGENQMDPGPQIVGAVYILHLPDDTFSDCCRIISQVIVSDTGQVYDLQKLYMATEGKHTSQDSADPVCNRCHSDDSFTQDVTRNIDTNRDETNSGFCKNSADQNDSMTNECVVCQNGFISIALLPCRHTCICSSCFPLLNRCPMCRGCIESFFPLNCGIDADWGRTHYAEDDGEEDDDDWVTKFNSSCERFSQWLGLGH